MSDDDLDMADRRRLADLVDPQPPKAERETGIDWFQTDERATITTYSPAIVRDLLRHREARINWIYATGSAEPAGRVRNPSQLLDADVCVEGVQATVPVGTLGVKGVVRASSRDSGVVKTPEAADDAREAFADGGRFILPGVGEHVTDREDGDELVVLDVDADSTADEAVLDEVGGLTVAELNPEYDDDAPVVDCVYAEAVEDTLDGWRSTEDLRDAVEFDALEVYTFPADRLGPVEEVAQ